MNPGGRGGRNKKKLARTFLSGLRSANRRRHFKPRAKVLATLVTTNTRVLHNKQTEEENGDGIRKLQTSLLGSSSLMPLLGSLHHRDDGETPTRSKATKPDSCTGTKKRGQGVLGRLCGKGWLAGWLTLNILDRGSERINIGGAFRLRMPPTQIRIKTPTLASAKLRVETLKGRPGTRFAARRHRG